MAYITDDKGNYKRTVRCGYCYETGHNRSSCQMLRQHLSDSIEKDKVALAKDEWEYDWQESDTRRRFEHNVKKLHKLESKGKGRKCGYCNKPGHTRRTCSLRKEEVQTATEKTLKFRRELCDRFISHGLGPGALVEVDVREHTGVYGEQRALAVVTSIDFSQIRESHKYDGSRWPSPSPRMIKMTLVRPVENRWHDGIVDCVSDVAYAGLLNTDNHEIHSEYNTERGIRNVVSPVVCGRDMMSAKSTDVKAVTKWVTNNIVDPR